MDEHSMTTSLPIDGARPLSLTSEPVAYRRLIGLSAFLCFALIMIGAWVRLTDAGLGTKDRASNYEFNVLLHDYNDVQ
ncbi:MAG: hypothetical protein EBW88_10190, partial [Betaproteobacteria bacterium]|nr:hypothetical protein [Betaproteobacteria bacterium]